MAEKLFAINARKKFQQLDTDGSGYLEGEELLHLAEWVWSSFHPDGEPLSDDERAKMSDKLLHRLDENSDGKLSMAEFEEYFLKTAGAIGNYRRRPSQLAATKGRAAHGKGAEDGGWEGKTVVIHSLKGRPELNGKKGKALKVSKETGRMGVHVGDEKLAIKIGNLRLDEPPDEPPKRERRKSIPDSLGTLVSGDPKSVAFTNARAMKKFKELDVDGSGFLEGDELLALAEWVWSSFHPEGTPLSPSEKAAMVEKLMHRIDENSDGRLSAAEFEEYFLKTASAIGNFRQRPSQLIYSRIRGLPNGSSPVFEPMPSVTPNSAASRGNVPPMTPQNSVEGTVPTTPPHKSVAEVPEPPPAKVNGAAHPPPPPPSAVAASSERAMKKFKELDADRSGFLEGDELLRLSEWVWSSFHPDGAPLAEGEKAAFVQKMLHRIDENADGRLSAAEFEDYFVKTAASIGRFRKSRASLAAKETKRSLRVVAADKGADPVVVGARAMKKFQALDADGSGFLEGDELLALAEWVWSSFHPEGTPLTEGEKAAMVEKLLHRIDENSDGKLSAAEFEDYFNKTIDAISRFRRRPTELKQSKPATITLGNGPPPLPAAPKISFAPMEAALARAEREAKEARDMAMARRLALDKLGMLKPVSSGPSGGDGSGEWVPCTDSAGGYVCASSKALNWFSASLEQAVGRGARTSFTAVPEDDEEHNAHVKGGEVQL